MNYIIEAFTNYIFLLPIFIILEIILYVAYKKNNIKIGIGYLFAWQLLACLITGITSITGSAGINNIIPHRTTIIRLDEINLVPLIHWGISDLFGLIMNIILFIPIGILLPILWKKGSSFNQTVLSGFIFSLLIELSQLFNWRATDIDDLLMNTFGVMVGYGLYYLLFRKITIFQVNNESTNKVIKYSPLLNVLLFFLLQFFIGKPYIRFIWDTIYR